MDNYTSNPFMTQSAHLSLLIGTYKEVFILLLFFFFLMIKKLYAYVIFFLNVFIPLELKK